MWHVLEHRKMKRLARGRETARHGPRPRPGQPAGTDLLPQIRHIVVLMMENHSYDNYLGMLSGRGEGFPLAADGQPDVSNSTADGETIRAFPQSSPVQRHGVPSQSWHASQGPRRYDRYGFRVPAVIVSPYARPGYVCSEIFDHTSVLRLVEEKWNLPALTARDATARAPLDALDLAGAPAFLEPPVLPEPSLRWGAW